METAIKRSNKQNREYKVLLGLVEYYLKTGKPVGSATLKEAEFAELSSATIRNYFARLEEEGYLVQQHSSGGRIPTQLAYRAYAREYADSREVSDDLIPQLDEIRSTETREIATFLQHSTEKLSEMTQTAAFMSAPRFDQDFIIGFRLLPLDNQRYLCVILTDFGTVKTELLHIDAKLSTFSCKRIETYFHWRLTGCDKPEAFEEEAIAHKIYNEVITRYVVSYSHFIETELYRTGFSKLLAYPDFHEKGSLAMALSLFEDTPHLRRLVKEACKMEQMRWWIGDELKAAPEGKLDATMIVIPYKINQSIAGAVGILGPERIMYREMFGIMRAFAKSISEALTRNLYKFQITFRQPHAGTYALEATEQQLIEGSSVMLLESKSGLTKEEQR